MNSKLNQISIKDCLSIQRDIHIEKRGKYSFYVAKRSERNKNGATRFEVLHADVKKKYRGSTIFVEFFRDLIMSIQNIDGSQSVIELLGEKNTSKEYNRNGYYSWARLGFEFAHESDRQDWESRTGFPSLIETMKHEHGRELWLKYGWQTDLVFHVDSTKQAEHFTDYYRKRTQNILDTVD